MISILSNNILNIPLYHGTSTLFLNSILENGLAGKNIIYEFKIIDKFKSLVTIGDDLLSHDTEWLSARYILEQIVSQNITDTGYNFRHGGAYLTPSINKAKYYATVNRYGSELLSQYFNVIDIIHNKLPSHNIISQIKGENPGTFNYYNKEHNPIVIKLMDIPIQYLKNENGDNPDEQVAEMDQFFKCEIEKYKKDIDIYNKAKEGDTAAFAKVFMEKERYKKNEQDFINEVTNLYWGQNNFELIHPIKVEKANIIELKT